MHCFSEPPEGVASPRGETTSEGVWHQQYTIMTDPDYNMMPLNLLLIYRYSAYQKQFNESRTPRVVKMHVSLFVGDGAFEIVLRQSGLICLPTTTLIMRCFWKLNFLCTLSFPSKMTSYTQLRYIVLQQFYKFFNGIVCLMTVQPLFRREVSRVLMTRHTRPARISNVKSPMLTNRSALISGA